MANIDALYNELFAKVIEDDERSQRHYLSMVEEHRKIPVDYLMSLGALFIPNNDYIRHYRGDKVLSSNAGLYYDGSCPWVMFVLLPIRNLLGEVVGLVGWDAYNKYKEVSEGAVGLVSYRVSAKSVFQRERYFLSDIDCLRRNFDSRVLFVTDGVFDTVSLCYRGIPAVALLGSAFSRELLYFMSWYKYVYVCADNDRAGLNLVKKLSRALPNVYRVVQNQTKDIEELMRTQGDFVKEQLQCLMNSPIKGDFILGSIEMQGRTRWRREPNKGITKLSFDAETSEEESADV